MNLSPKATGPSRTVSRIPPLIETFVFLSVAASVIASAELNPHWKEAVRLVDEANETVFVLKWRSFEDENLDNVEVQWAFEAAKGESRMAFFDVELGRTHICL